MGRWVVGCLVVVVTCLSAMISGGVAFVFYTLIRELLTKL